MMDLHVTQIGQCQRKWWHQIMGHQKLPNHYLSVKGILTHSVIERCLKDGVGKLDIAYPNLLEGRTRKDDIDEAMYNACLTDAKPCVDNFGRWVTETKHNLPDFTSESQLAYDYEGFTIKGTPDLHNDRVIIDFKTGKPVLREKYVEQIGAYAWLLKRIKGIDIQEGEIVFFGTDEPITKTVSSKKLMDGQEEWIRQLNADVEFINSVVDNLIKNEAGIPDGEWKEIPPMGECKFDISCAYCGYRGICNGI